MTTTPTSWAEMRAQGGIAVAVTATMFAQLAISAVETLAVARLGAGALAGVTLALSLYLLVFLAALGVVTAVTPLAAQALGRADEAAVRRIGQQGILLGLAVALPGVVILLAAGFVLPHAIGAGPSAEAGRLYLFGAAWGLPAWVCYVAVRSLAIAVGRVRVTTVLMAAALPIHAALTWWLVFGGGPMPPLGALGAGLSYTFTAVAVWCVLMPLVRSRTDVFASVFRGRPRWDGVTAREIAALGVPFAGRILLREGVLPATAFVIAPYGPSVLAAHAVAVQVGQLASVFTFGISAAASTRTGHAIGANAPGAARHASWIAVRLGALCGAVVALGLTLGAAPIAGWVLGHDSAAAATLIPFAAGLAAA